MPNTSRYYSPSTAPRSAGLMGGFGKRMFERSEFPLDAQKGEQRRGKAVAGSPSFWVLLLGEARKSTQKEGEIKR